MVTSSRAPVRADRLRALNVPVRVEVELDAAGMPVAVREKVDGSSRDSAGSGDRRTKGARECITLMDDARRVEEILEIWRIDDEWWRKPVSRRYVDVAMEGGGHMVLFENLMTNEWFMQKP